MTFLIEAYLISGIVSGKTARCCHSSYSTNLEPANPPH